MERKREYMILHVDLFVRSMDVALDFYCNKLGYSIVEDAALRGAIARRVSKDQYDALRLVLLRSSSVGAMIELQQFEPDSALTDHAATSSLRTGWISILVPDLRRLMQALRMQGVLPRSEVFSVKLANSRTCELVFYQDPDGNDLEFMQIKS